MAMQTKECRNTIYLNDNAQTPLNRFAVYTANFATKTVTNRTHILLATRRAAINNVALDGLLYIAVRRA